VTTVLITIGVLLLGLAIAPRLAVPKTFVVVAVLALPILLELPGQLRHEGRAIKRDLRLSYVQAVIAPPPSARAGRNDALLLGIRRRVPPGASVSFAPGGRWKKNPSGFLTTSRVRWTAFVIAPRVVVEGTAPWVVVVGQTPAEAGIHPRQAWRFGSDWLVRR
jgi:hypothetical protein